MDGRSRGEGSEAGPTLREAITRARRHTISDILARTAARHPERDAIVYAGERTTYGELNEAVSRSAAALAARGLSKGDRVALLSHNSRDFVVIYFALARLGVISVPINFMLGETEVAYILNHCDASGMVVEDELLSVAEGAIEQAGLADPLRVRGLIGAPDSEAAGGWEPIREWESHAEDPPDLSLDDDEPVQILYTSGTEARPKGAIMTSRNLITQYVSCITAGHMTGDDIEVHSMPLFHTAQLHVFLMPSIYLGARNLILPGPDPAAMLEAIASERATKLFCPPTIWLTLLRHPDFDQFDLESLRKGYYGAAIMPIELIKELTERLPNVRLFNFYGQTELGSLATALGPEDQVRKLGSVGKSVINTETRLVDDDGNTVATGEVGEIVHRSPQVTPGYWNDPDGTAKAFRTGWFHSGDLATADEEGYITIVDRKKDMIKTGGENVASREVEEVLYRHPAVGETAVFGVPHPHWIEAVAAAVVPRGQEPIVEEELIAFCREHLAGFKTPKYVVVVDSLPKNASGKILKRDLKQHFQDLAQSEAE